MIFKVSQPYFFTKRFFYSRRNINEDFEDDEGE